jgi:hypothetical protein
MQEEISLEEIEKKAITSKKNVSKFLVWFECH